MRFVSLCLLLCFSTVLWAAQSMSVDKLLDFVRSSLALKYDDAKIAKYVKTVTLTDKLDQKTIESLEAQGAGPKTVKALQDLQQETAKLPAPKSAAPANPITGKTGMSMPARYPQPPALDSVRQKEVLDAMRNYATTYVQSLPNYLCVEVIERSVSFNGGEDYHPEDKVFVKLSFAEGKENYKVYLVNNHAVDTSLEKLGGAISSGEFGSLMSSIFDKKSQADFAWARWGKLRGKVMPVFQLFHRQRTLRVVTRLRSRRAAHLHRLQRAHLRRREYRSDRTDYPRSGGHSGHFPDSRGDHHSRL